MKNGLAPLELKFKWKKDGKPIEVDALDKKYEILRDGDTYKLKIKKFNKKDEGVYEIYLDEPSDYEISSSATIQLEPGMGKKIIILNPRLISKRTSGKTKHSF